jgi:ABC-type branched-subunit amino acid transport system substrate-binding protein
MADRFSWIEEDNVKMRIVGASVVVSVLAVALSGTTAHAQKKYDAGASDTEVKIGQTMPYSGPVSVLSIEGRVQVAYYKMINERGGINGRTINLISVDDGYSPPKTVEQTRRLVEQEGVLALVGSLGTPTNVAVRKYLNQKKVPQLLVLSSSAQWNKPEEYPYSTSMFLAADQEAIAMGKYIAQTHPGRKIGILYQNDDYGKDFVRGLKEGLGDNGRHMIVKDLGHEVADPTIDSQVVSLKAAGADIFVAATTTRFAALAIRKVSELQWKPVRILAGGAISSLKAVLDPEIAKGLVSMSFYRDPSDPKLETEKDGQEYFAFMKKYAPNDNPKEMSALLAYLAAQVGAHIISESGDDLTRENLLKVATNLNHAPVKLLLDGVAVSTSPTNYLPVKSARFVEFDGTSWSPFGASVDVSETISR